MPQPPRQDRLTPATARWLVSDVGLRAVAEATERWSEAPDPLALGTSLRASGLDHHQAAAVISAADARLRMPAQLARAGCVLTRAALEQASHPDVARWRAGRFSGGNVADLGCGAGLDATTIAARGPHVVGIDRDEARAVLAAHNSSALGVPVSVVVGDALRPPVGLSGRLAHSDPSRRGPRGRAKRLADYQPAVGDLQQVISEADGYAVVVSPAVDLTDADLPAGEIEFVQVGRDLVEAVVWGGQLARPGVLATATLLPGAVTRERTEAVQELPVGPIGPYVLEVVPAAVRARLHDEIGAEIGARRLATRRALLTCDSRPAPSPWWVSWEVDEVLPARPRAVRDWLRGAPELPVELASTGADLDLDRFWRDIGSPRRGPGGRRLLAVRTDTGTVVVALRSVGE